MANEHPRFDGDRPWSLAELRTQRQSRGAMRSISACAFFKEATQKAFRLTLRRLNRLHQEKAQAGVLATQEANCGVGVRR
jgi:hypothetical protein